MKYYRYLLIVTLLAVVGLMTRPALAHERVEIGPYVVVVGWLNEPAIVGERNAVFIAVTENDQPVTGVEATLDAELLYGGRSFRANLNPTPAPGEYTVELFPTVRGQYSVRLFGAIGDTQVDEVIEPEEVFAADRIQFPEPQPDVRELQRETQQAIADLQASVQRMQIVAFAGVGIGIAGVALALWSMRRR